MNRRQFVYTTLPLAASFSPLLHFSMRQKLNTPYKLKLSCNLYSFNAPLRSGEMSLEEVIDFCAELGFDAVDPTGYYFAGYPIPPADDYIYGIKKRAFLQGLDISGTGVRNDFTTPDASLRAADLSLIKQWVDVAAKMDAPVLRVFTGRNNPEGYSYDQVLEWIIAGFKEATRSAARRGVMIVLQNHNEVLKTAEEVLVVSDRVDSEWFGLNVDIGSLPTGDPYEEIARLAPFACTWQIKENLNRNGIQEKTDLKKVMGIIKNAGYRGYIPIETLGEGDPKLKVTRFLEEVKNAIS